VAAEALDVIDKNKSRVEVASLALIRRGAAPVPAQLDI
jgi:hypothetical protein